MKRNILLKSFLSLTLPVFLLASCTEDKIGADEVVTVTGLETAYKCPSAGVQDIVFDISSNVSWKVTVLCEDNSICEWCHVSPVSSEISSLEEKIIVTVDDNEESRARKGKIVVFTKSLSDPHASAEIIQDPKGDFSVALAEGSPEMISHEGGTVDILVTSNKAWTITSAESWLTLDKEAGEAGEGMTVRATAAPNSGSYREAEVSVLVDNVQKSVKVAQDGLRLKFVVDEYEQNISSQGLIAQYTVDSNVGGFEVEVDESLKISGLVCTVDGDKVNVTIPANIYFVTRTITLKLKSTQGIAVETIPLVFTQEIDFKFIDGKDNKNFYEIRDDGSVTFVKQPGAGGTHPDIYTISKNHKYGTLEFELNPDYFNMYGSNAFQIDCRAGLKNETAYWSQMLIQCAYQNKGFNIGAQPAANNVPVGTDITTGKLPNVANGNLTFEQLGNAKSLKIVFAKSTTSKCLDLSFYVDGSLVHEDKNRLVDPWQIENAGVNIDLPGYYFYFSLIGNTTGSSDDSLITVKSIKFTPSEE